MIKPRFISFEGGEGSGKSTQIKLLAKKLSKYGDVITTREPAGKIEADVIRKLLVKGKNNKTYNYRTAFCLETQHFPDSPNNENLPSTELNPGEEYYSICIYKFSVIE